MSNGDGSARRLAGALTAVPTWALGTLSVVGFVFAVQMLGAGTSQFGPVIERWLRGSLEPDVAALGAGWLGAYGVLNGSVVAAVAISLFDAGVVTARELFYLVVGSRLGSSGVIVFIGALDHLQHRGTSVEHSVGLGLFSFLVTHSIYLPLAVVGAVALPWTMGVAPVASQSFSLPLLPELPLLGGPATWVSEALGPLPTLALALVLFLASLRAVETVFARTDTDGVADRYLAVLDHPNRSFLVGLLVTVVTMSVSVSVGLMVPLFNRGYTDSDAMGPYVLGASLGTLADSFLVALVLGSPLGTFVVGYVFLVGVALTVVVLLVATPYFAALDRVYDRLSTDRRWLAGFVGALVVVPVLVVAVALLN